MRVISPKTQLPGTAVFSPLYCRTRMVPWELWSLPELRMVHMGMGDKLTCMSMCAPSERSHIKKKDVTKLKIHKRLLNIQD